MATRNRSNSNDGRNGRGRSNGARGNRSRSTKQSNNSSLLMIEIAGGVALVVALMVFFGGGSGNTPPRNKGAVKPAKPIATSTEKKPKRTYKPSANLQKYISYGVTFDGDPGKKPGRPAPKVDLTQGKLDYKESQRLWNLSQKQRGAGDTAKARETLWKAYRLIDNATSSLRKFNNWVEDADMEDWAVDRETRKSKKVIDRWENLRSRIHKILPKTRK